MSVSVVHHLNAATLCPRVPARLFGQRGKAKMVCHCLVLETAKDGLILVDTGFGTADVADTTRLPWLFRTMIATQLSADETVLAQLAARGFRADDVRHIVVTHLDLDHAGGLGDFPSATVHVHARELAAATAARKVRERMRYRAVQWSHGPKWQTYETAGDTWRGVPAIRKLVGVDADVALLPMHGHSHGHSTVLVGHGGKHLVHAGDAYFHRSAVTQAPAVPLGLRLFEADLRVDKAAHLASVEALRALRASHADLEMFCAHDPEELAAYTSAR